MLSKHTASHWQEFDQFAIFPRNICSLCPNIRKFRSGGAEADSCSGTLPLNIVIEFVTLRLEAGHYMGEPQELQNIWTESMIKCNVWAQLLSENIQSSQEAMPASVTGTGCLFVLTNESGKVGTNASLPAALQERHWGKEVGARFASAVARSAWAQLFTPECDRESLTLPDLHFTKPRVMEKSKLKLSSPQKFYFIGKVLFNFH